MKDGSGLPTYWENGVKKVKKIHKEKENLKDGFLSRKDKGKSWHPITFIIIWKQKCRIKNLKQVSFVIVFASIVFKLIE